MPPLRQRTVQRQWPSRQAGACRPEQAVPVVAAGGAASPRSLNEIAAAEVSVRLTLPTPFSSGVTGGELPPNAAIGHLKTDCPNLERGRDRACSRSLGPQARPSLP